MVGDGRKVIPELAVFSFDTGTREFAPRKVEMRTISGGDGGARPGQVVLGMGVAIHQT